MRITKKQLGTLQTNSYLVISEKNNAVLIDIGQGASEILNIAKKENIIIKKIFLTHGHFDHILGVSEIVENTSAMVYISKGDEEMLNDCTKNLGEYCGYSNCKNIALDVIVADGDEISLDELTFKVIETPGHTKGSVLYICNDNIFSGDTLFKEEVGRIDLYGGSYKQLKQSLEKFKKLDGEYNIFCGHGEDTTLAYELANNRYLGAKKIYDDID
jgi:hydroxyacylglutathione hydrolase